MRYKILIPKKNTNWGIMKDPIKGNIYNHILNFENEEAKNQFICNQLLGLKFNTSTHHYWKNLVNEANDIHILPINEMKFNFEINLDQQNQNYHTVPKLDYKTMWRSSLIDLSYADFCIIKDGEDYRFYALKVLALKPNSILFEAELDIFFTYNITNLFYNKQIPIDRAHFNNFNKDFKLDNITTPLISSEPFEFEETDFLPTRFINSNDNTQNYGINVSVSKVHKPHKGFNWLDLHLIYLKLPTYILNMAWKVIYKKPPPGWEGEDTYIDGSIVPYNIYIAPANDIITFKVDNRKVKLKWYVGVKEIAFVRFNIGKNIIEDVENYGEVIGNTHTIFYDKYLLHKICDVDVNKRLKLVIGYHEDGNYYSIYLDNNLFNAENAKMCNLGLTAFVRIKNIDTNNTNELTYDISTKNKYPNKGVEKLNLYPYRFFKYKVNNGEGINLLPQYFRYLDSDINIENKFIFDPENWRENIRIKNYNTLNYEYKELPYGNSPKYLPHNVGGYNQISNYTLPTLDNAYQQYITRNRKSIDIQSIQNKTNLGLSVIGTFGALLGAAFAKGGSGKALAGAGILGGASSISNAVFNMKKLEAKIGDIKNTPGNFLIGGGNLITDYALQGLIPRLVEYQLPPWKVKEIGNFFKLFGYEFSGTLHNINALIDNKKIFNYLKATGTFENIKMTLSPKIKQIINDTLEKGITIWHIKKGVDFKGIYNYKEENQTIKRYEEYKDD